MLDYRLTHSGKTLNLRAPAIDDIDLHDIAHHLGQMCRFGGACNQFFSVAQHCVHVVHLVAQCGGSREQMRWAILHDAAEYMLEDIGTPVKALIREASPVYDDLSRVWDNAISARFGVPICNVTLWDTVALLVERRWLGPHGNTDDELIGRPVTPEERSMVDAAFGVIPWSRGTEANHFIDHCSRLGIYP